MEWILLFTLVFSSTVLAENSPNEIKFISVADIHFDPFSSCHKKLKTCVIINKLQKTDYKNWPKVFEQYDDKLKGKPYEDTNYRLLVAMLNQIKVVSKNQNPAFMIILGDFLSHEFREDYRKYSHNKSEKQYQEFVKQTFQFMANEFSKTFPTLNIYPVIGNNDSYHGDYNSIPRGKFYHDMTYIWAGLIYNQEDKNKFINSFPITGYYEINLQPSGSKLIVLNSVIFSIHTKEKGTYKAAFEQLQWLNEQLNNAEKNNQKIIIAYHIPVGVDLYSTIQNGFDNISQFWNDKYTTIFEKELRTHKLVSAILSGHIHIDSLQAINLKQFAGIPVNLTPSISPIFGNNPAFKVITLNSNNLRILDSQTYYHPLNQSAHFLKTKKMKPLYIVKLVKQSF